MRPLVHPLLSEHGDGAPLRGPRRPRQGGRCARRVPALSCGSRPGAGGAHDPASGVSRPTPSSSACRRASHSGGLLDPGRRGHQTGQGPRARDGVLQLQRVRQRQLQHALQIRARAEPRQGVGAPDRALAPAAQPPQPTRLGGGLAGLGRVPEAGAARAQGRPFPLRARQAGRLAIGRLSRLQGHGGRARERLPARDRRRHVAGVDLDPNGAAPGALAGDQRRARAAEGAQDRGAGGGWSARSPARPGPAASGWGAAARRRGAGWPRRRPDRARPATDGWSLPASRTRSARTAAESRRGPA